MYFPTHTFHHLQPVSKPQVQQPPQQQTPSQPQRSSSQPSFPRQQATAMPTFQFQPVQGVPMVYPQTTNIVPDSASGWYYGNMMVYPVPAPQHYIPAQYATQVLPSQMFPVNHPYSIAPGIIGQSALMSPPSTRPAAMRLTSQHVGGVPVESIVSPPHTATGVTLVRPIPQQVSI